ncbi:hypothetical protein [Lysinibacillus xylanilyticus]|uniref:hypothetical protein n=1 Tax=Lysinibacillus xylanilyticus TaxID=582475 RepID=UPI003D065044
MSRSRKHGVFAVRGDVVVISGKQKEMRKDDKEIQKALETIFHQMRIAGNRPRTQGDSNKFYIVNYIPKKYIEEGFSLYVLPQADVMNTAYIRGGWHGREGFQIKFPDESWAYGNLNLVSESDLTKMHEAIYLPTDEEIDQMVNDELGIE